ncbi:MAG TPA: hypothetical protein EYG68_03500 [Leucothrix mucor]|nr:hypothetical protein [Leucothrix mucor]
MSKYQTQTVYLVDGTRTPFNRQLRHSPNDTSAYSKLDLGLITARALLLKQALTSTQLDDVIVTSSTSNSNDDLAQQLSQRLGCNTTMRAQTFSAGENCGLQALEYAHQQLAFEQKSLILISGIETSNAKPITLNTELSQWIREWKNSQGFTEKLKIFSKLHTRHFLKESNSKQGQDCYYQQHKETAEKIANYFSLSAEAMAEYVKLSQRRLKYAQRNKLIKNIVPLFYPDGSSLYRDEDIINTDPESLKQTIITGNPPTGIITKASVAQATEGACTLLLANQTALDKYNLTPLAKLSAPTWNSHNKAIDDLLTSSHHTASDIDFWEWDETSAAEILALEKSPDFESIDAFRSLSTVNIDGGSLALGSPNSANKLRCILQLAYILQRNNAKNGICHFNAVSGQNSALLLQNMQESDK